MNPLQKIFSALFPQATPAAVEQSTSGAVMSDNFIALAKQRRTIYALGKKLAGGRRCCDWKPSKKRFAGRRLHLTRKVLAR